MAGKIVWRKESACGRYCGMVIGHFYYSFCSRVSARTCVVKDSGIGEGLSPSSAADLIARFIPLQERSRAVSVVYDGSSFGSVLGLLFAPPIIQNLGWESAFYILGLLGIIWCLGFESLKEQKLGENEGTLNLGPSSAGSDGLISSAVSSKSSNSSLEDTQNSLKDVPWGAFFKSKAVWAMIYAHFCGSWGHYTCLSWLPTFFSQELNLSLAEAAWVSILPPLGSMVVTSIVAPFADNLISNGVDTTKVRKICQTISFVSPAIFLMLSSMDLGLPPWEIVAFLTIGLSLSNFALSGLYCTHQDISREYASILLGITTTIGSVPGIVGIALTGYLLDSTHSWSVWHQSIFVNYISFYEPFLIPRSCIILSAGITLCTCYILLLNWYCSMVSVCQQ
ncbi:hypothetical protein SEVIR_1G126500v4 [Setaria viridis]